MQRTLGTTVCGRYGEFSPEEKAMLHGEDHGGCPSRDAHLGVRVLYVMVGRLPRDAEDACHLLRLQAAREKHHHVHLPLGEPAGRCRRGTGCPAAEGTAATLVSSKRPAATSAVRASPAFLAERAGRWGRGPSWPDRRQPRRGAW